MVLSNQSLKKLIKDAPYYGPCSVDLTLGDKFATIPQDHGDGFGNSVIDFAAADEIIYENFECSSHIIIEPMEFLLATTNEIVEVPDDMAAYVEGRSSVGRLGLQVQNAGFIDSGFKGEITLELCNQTQLPMKIYPGMRICQVVYMMLDEKTDSPYNGKYNGQSGATVSRFEGLI